MNWNWQRTFMLIIVAFAFSTPSVFAQKAEFGVYGGGYWPTRTSVGELKSEGMFGIRGGGFVGSGVELEGNVARLTQFEVKGISANSKGWLLEFATAYNFTKDNWYTSDAFTPFLLLGVGGIRTKVDAPYSFTNINGDRTTNVSDGDTFFSISYGGGFKSIKVAGPVGFRVDVRGRTLPNYYHSTPTWLEANVGINFMW